MTAIKIKKRQYSEHTCKSENNRQTKRVISGTKTYLKKKNKGRPFTGDEIKKLTEPLHRNWKDEARESTSMKLLAETFALQWNIAN